MSTFASKAWDMLRLVRHGGPAICNIAITNSCNASCDFCNFARGKVSDLRWIDIERFGDALDILHLRGIRYLNIFGGEPLLHPDYGNDRDGGHARHGACCDYERLAVACPAR